MTTEEGRQLVESMVNVGNLVMVVWGDRTMKPVCGYSAPARGHTPIETIQTFAMAYVQLESICKLTMQEMADSYAGKMGPHGPQTPKETFALFVRAIQEEAVRLARVTPCDSTFTTLPPTTEKDP